MFVRPLMSLIITSQCPPPPSSSSSSSSDDLLKPSTQQTKPGTPLPQELLHREMGISNQRGQKRKRHVIGNKLVSDTFASSADFNLLATSSGKKRLEGGRSSSSPPGFLGLCALLQTTTKPPDLQECSKEVLPSLILLFDGLKRAYAAKALDAAETDSEEEEDVDVEDALCTDEDDIDDEGLEYLEVKLEKNSKNAPFPMSTEIATDDDDDDWYEEDDEDAVEVF